MNLAEFKERYDDALYERAFADAIREAAEQKKNKGPSLEGLDVSAQLPIIVVRQEQECVACDAPDDEEDEEPQDLKKDLGSACSLLQTAMHHLGFYGDPKSCGLDRRFSVTDQRIMAATAEEIQEFLERVWNEGFANY